MTDIEQTLGEKILALADEAEAIAAAHPQELALHHKADDLHRVLVAHAARFGVVRAPVELPPVEQDVSPEAPAADGSRRINLSMLRAPADDSGAEPPPPADMSVFIQRPEFEALVKRVEALENRKPSDLPSWLSEALQNLHERLETLESRANFQDVHPDHVFVAENYEPDPAAWESVEEAHKALRNMVRLQYQKRADIRMKVLGRMSYLLGKRLRDNISDAEEAELMQHQQRTDTQELLDATLSKKLDEVLAIDDLEVARHYDPAAGWE